MKEMETEISAESAEIMVAKAKGKKQVFILFLIRIFLWVVAAVSTFIWMYYSAKLHQDGIFEPSEYATLLRPVLYTCLIIAIVAICISFILHAVSVRIKRKLDIR